MDKIEELLLNSINNYYAHLSKLGTISQENQCTLLVLLLLKQIVTGPMKEFITEDDYKILENVLHCLDTKSCLININQFTKEQLLNICTDEMKIFKILDNNS